MKNLSKNTNDLIGDFLMAYNKIGKKNNLEIVSPTLVEKAINICISNYHFRTAIFDGGRGGKVNLDKIENMLLSVDEWKFDKSFILEILNGYKRAKLSIRQYQAYNNLFNNKKGIGRDKFVSTLVRQYLGKEKFKNLCVEYGGKNIFLNSLLDYIMDYLSKNKNTFEAAEKLYDSLNEKFKHKN